MPCRAPPAGPSRPACEEQTVIILINKRECVLGCCLLFCVPAATAAASAADDLPAHEYSVQVDAELDRLDVRANFAFPVRRVRARSSSAERYIENLQSCDGEPLRIRYRHIELPAAGIRCLRYEVRLRAAAARDRRNGSMHRDNLLASPSVWLWRPALNESTELRVRFEAPPAVGVSAPWQPLDRQGREYRIPTSPENADAAVAFGEFVDARREIPGATLRVALMRPGNGRVRPELIDWAAEAARNVSLSYGRLPNPSPHVVVVPIDSSRNGPPVPFGRVVRDGGESVELFVRRNASLDSLYADWTATHEFSHLMLPYLGSRYRWVSEGFAQYLQNVLLARSGTYTEQRAWQKLYEGFRRGEASRPELSPIAAAASRARGATMKVYWSGAVLALEADVELRRRSGGEQSLDTVLHAFMRCCLPAKRRWRGTELLEKLDELAGMPVFMPLYHRHGEATGFPDYDQVFAELGVAIVRNRVVFEDDAPLASTRRAMLAPRTADQAARSLERGSAADGNQQDKQDQPAVGPSPDNGSSSSRSSQRSTTG